MDNAADIAFWNVGQGNCTLLKSPGASSDTPGYLWIIDAGSFGGNPRRNWDFNDNSGNIKTAQLVQDIQNWIGPSSFRVVNFVISHPDIDHYNLMNKIRSMFIGTVKVRLFVGKEYSNLEKYYPTLHLGADELVPIDGQASYDWTGAPAKEELSVIFFLNNAGRNPKSADNDNSLIVLVRYGLLSFLLTGDATETTYQNSNIYSIDWSKFNIILQISHHGAATDGSTSLKLLEKVQPKVFIISAPLVVGSHDHPKNEVFQQIVSYCKKYPDKIYIQGLHFLCSNNENSDITQIIPEADTFLFRDLVLLSQFHTKTKLPKLKDICVTLLPIYTTGSNGTIYWKWNDKDGLFGCFDAEGVNLKTLYDRSEVFTASINILTTVQKNQLAPLSFRLVLDKPDSGVLEYIRNSLIPDKLLILNLIQGAFKNWKGVHADVFLKSFPKLQNIIMRPDSDQLDADYLKDLSSIEKRFYDFKL